MIVAIDVHYRTNFAKVVAIEFEHWDCKNPDNIIELTVDEVAPYESGAFYKRELPCIMEVLKGIDLGKVEAIIIDGYVTLDDQGKAGLGKYLFDELDGTTPVIGVAKRSFIHNKNKVIEVLRGASKNPLYITSIDFDLRLAANKIKQMVGAYRIPDLLKILDQHTKN